MKLKDKKKETKKSTKSILKSDGVLTEFVCVIDRSGSMQSIADDAIGGFNKFLEEQQKLPGEAILTMVLFDHEYIVTYNGTPIADVAPLNHKTYVPRGTTALFDAVGRAITSVRERYEAPGANKKARIMLVILTDGMENASHEYGKDAIMGMIKNCQDNLGWAVLYLTASPDAFSDAHCMGINSTNVLQFAHTTAGTASMNAVYSCAASDYRIIW